MFSVLNKLSSRFQKKAVEIRSFAVLSSDKGCHHFPTV